MYVFVCAFFALSGLVGCVSYEGDHCSKNGVSGTCQILSRCPSAISELREKIRPQICSFSNWEPIVCCVVGQPPAPTRPPAPARPPPLAQRPTSTTFRPVATTTPRSSRPTTTTEYIPPVADYGPVDSSAPSGCAPLPPTLTAPRTGQKAWDKCIEYQENIVYPCENSVALAATAGVSRISRCNHNTDELIIGGVNAARGEFPHMVQLGFGEQPGNWLCAGSLLSDRFILTAGHCTYSREFGNITFARVGALKRNDQLDSSRLYKIGSIIKHPDYKPPNKYNDIALLKTETPMKLDQYAVPACLDVGAGVVDDKVSASGWGLTSYNGQQADHLQKVILSKFSTAECSAFFGVERLLKQGLDEATQTCYGDRTESKDTCQGDSGGPIQVKNRKISCMYTVVGVTSFGKGCGTVGMPAVYTRVSHYVSWIENIVWPS